MAKQYGPPKKKKKCAACAHKGSSPKVKGGHDFMNHPAAKAIADIGRVHEGRGLALRSRVGITRCASWRDASTVRSVDFALRRVRSETMPPAPYDADDERQPADVQGGDGRARDAGREGERASTHGDARCARWGVEEARRSTARQDISRSSGASRRRRTTCKCALATRLRVCRGTR